MRTIYVLTIFLLLSIPLHATDLGEKGGDKPDKLQESDENDRGEQDGQVQETAADADRQESDGGIKSRTLKVVAPRLPLYKSPPRTEIGFVPTPNDRILVLWKGEHVMFYEVMRIKAMSRESVWYKVIARQGTKHQRKGWIYGGENRNKTVVKIAEDKTRTRD